MALVTCNHYSLLKLSTGSARAAFKECVTTVRMAIIKMKAAGNKKMYGSSEMWKA
jgi:hypothetical protein